MSRFTTGARVINTRTLGILIRPVITDTEKGQTATFVPDADILTIAANLNAGVEAPGKYRWEDDGSRP